VPQIDVWTELLFQQFERMYAGVSGTVIPETAATRLSPQQFMPQDGSIFGATS
jgi:hypothetical protein